jgi:hypothetical protein
MLGLAGLLRVLWLDVKGLLVVAGFMLLTTSAGLLHEELWSHPKVRQCGMHWRLECLSGARAAVQVSRSDLVLPVRRRRAANTPRTVRSSLQKNRFPCSRARARAQVCQRCAGRRSGCLRAHICVYVLRAEGAAGAGGRRRPITSLPPRRNLPGTVISDERVPMPYVPSIQPCHKGYEAVVGTTDACARRCGPLPAQMWACPCPAGAESAGGNPRREGLARIFFGTWTACVGVGPLRTCPLQRQGSVLPTLCDASGPHLCTT